MGSTGITREDTEPYWHQLYPADMHTAPPTDRGGMFGVPTRTTFQMI
jgi:hypothetical protein